MGNPMLDRIEAKWRNYYNNLFQMRINMLLQMGQDCACFAANKALQMGPKRAPDFCVAYREAYEIMATVFLADQKDDEEFWYAKNWRDENIKRIVGEENFAPWEVCYPGTR